MRVFIPSTNRALATLKDGPLAQLPETVNPCYVVPNEDYARYCEVFEKYVHRPITVTSCPVTGIAQTRAWIGNIADKKFCMMDDDVKFVRRIDKERTTLMPANSVDVAQMLNAVEDLLDDYAHVGVSARGGNNNRGPGDFHELLVENTRTLRVLAYRTDVFRSVVHGRVEVMEDFDVNLQILGMGYKNVDIGWYAQDQRMTNAPGGCSSYRTHAVHESSARRLAELHPGVVTLRQKKNKTDAGGFGTRTEVTIQWKRKYLQGVRDAKEA